MFIKANLALYDCKYATYNCDVGNYAIMDIFINTQYKYTHNSYVFIAQISNIIFGECHYNLMVIGSWVKDIEKDLDIYVAS